MLFEKPVSNKKKKNPQNPQINPAAWKKLQAGISLHKSLNPKE